MSLPRNSKWLSKMSLGMIIGMRMNVDGSDDVAVLALKKRAHNLIGIISKDIGYLSALSTNDYHCHKIFTIIMLYSVSSLL